MTEAIRILLIEDDAGLRSILAGILEADGYRVTPASSGDEAVHLVSQAPCDIVVTDIRMEGIDGLQALSRVREQQPEVEGMVVTGYSTEEYSTRALELGVKAYLKKPFSHREFLGSVNRIAAQQRREHQRAEQVSRLINLTGWVGRVTPNLNAASRGLLFRSQALALELAQASGMPAGLLEQVTLATLLMGIQRLTMETCPDELVPTPLVRRVLRHASERWDGTGQPDGLSAEAIPLECRVVQVALHAVLDQGTEHSGLDPQLAQLAQRMLAVEDGDLTQDPEAAGRQPESWRHLLFVARTLEQSRNYEDAWNAYQRLAGHGVAEASAWSCLGQARLAAQLGRAGEAGPLAREAARRAAQAGPQTLGMVLLEAGELLLSLNGTSSDEMLAQAERHFVSLRLPGFWARAFVLQAAAWAPENSSRLEQALGILVEFEHLHHLARVAGPILNRLIACAQRGPVFLRALQRTVNHFPTEVSVLVKNGMEVDCRRQLARAVAATGVDSSLVALLGSDPDPMVRSAMSTVSSSGDALLLRIHSLGIPEVIAGECPVVDGWRTRKTRFLFFYLASRRGVHLPDEHLLDLFWPGDPKKARNCLNVAISTIRKCLRESGLHHEYVERTQDCVRWNPDAPCWHDVDELEKASDKAVECRAQGRVREALSPLYQVVELYRGPYLEGCYEDWAVQARHRIEGLVVEAFLALASEALATGRHAEAVQWAQRSLDLDEFRQDAHLIVINAELAQGKPECALRQYDLCRRILKEELEMEPSIELERAHQRARMSLT